MKIEIGQVWLTRGGERCEIIGVNPYETEYPFQAKIGDDAITLTRSGKYWDDNEVDDSDLESLVSEPVKITVPDEERLKIQRETVRAVLDLFRVDGSAFRYNGANDYGSIDLILWTGEGDPMHTMRGEEIIQQYRQGPARSGMFKLNDVAVDFVLGKIAGKVK